MRHSKLADVSFRLNSGCARAHDSKNAPYAWPKWKNEQIDLDELNPMKKHDYECTRKVEMGFDYLKVK